MNPTLKEDLKLLKKVMSDIRRKLKNKKYYQENKQQCKDNSKRTRESVGHKEKTKSYNQLYYEENKEHIKSDVKIYRDNHKEPIAEYKTKYWNDNKDKLSAYYDNYYEEHADKLKDYSRGYYQDNKSSRNEYIKKRRKEDINFHIAACLRVRISSALKKHYKVGSAVRDLGCSIDDLKLQFKSRFYGDMTMDNYGVVWHIDHIIPLSSFDLTDRTQFLKAVHYTNLQPLLVEDNLRKSNKVDYKRI
jgi:hypothetical protein